MAFNGCLSVSNLQPKTDLLEFRAIHSVLYHPTNHMSTEDIHVWLVGRLFSLIHSQVSHSFVGPTYTSWRLPWWSTCMSSVKPSFSLDNYLSIYLSSHPSMEPCNHPLLTSFPMSALWFSKPVPMLKAQSVCQSSLTVTITYYTGTSTYYNMYYEVAN